MPPAMMTNAQMLMNWINRPTSGGVAGFLSQSSMDFMRYLLKILLEVIEPDLFLVELVDLPASYAEIREELAMLPNKMLQGSRG